MWTLYNYLRLVRAQKLIFPRQKKPAPGNKYGAAGRLASEAERKEIVSKFCDDHKNVLKEKIYTVWKTVGFPPPGCRSHPQEKITRTLTAAGGRLTFDAHNLSLSEAERAAAAASAAGIKRNWLWWHSSAEYRPLLKLILMTLRPNTYLSPKIE